MNWLLIILIALLALYMVSGYTKGFLSMLYRLVVWVVIWALVAFATPYVCDYIREHTSLEETIEKTSEEKISELVVAATEDLEKSEGEQRVERVNELLGEKAGIRMPEVVVSILVGQEKFADDILENTGVYEKVSSKIASMTLLGISFLICLLVLVVASKILSRLIDHVNKVPVIGFTNRLLGFALGGIKGIAVIWTGFAIVALNASTNVGMWITTYIYDSKLLTWMYENNLLVQLFMVIWN